MQYLISGFMGAGKTTLTKKLQNTHGNDYKIYDLDNYVLDEYSDKFLEKYCDLIQLIEKQGWEKFRSLELNSLRAILAKYPNVIISLGGGTLSSENCYDYIKTTNCKIIYLKYDFETLWSRIKDDQQRPLVQLGRAKVEEIFKKRCKTFEKADHIVSDTTDVFNLIA